MALVSIKGLDKADVFAALYNAAQPVGMGFLQYDPTPLTKEQAEELMKAGDDVKRMFPNDCKVSDDAKHDSRELATAIWLYDQAEKS